MADTLAMRTFEDVNTGEFADLPRLARLETFAGAYCRALAGAGDEALASEASALGVPVEQLRALAGNVNAPVAQALADVLRLFGDRDSEAAAATEIDELFAELLGASGFEGTIPG